MSPLIPYIWLAGAVHVFIVAMNVPLPKMLGYREELARVSPIIRQIFVVHSIYILLVLIGLSLLCFRFAPQLAGGSPIGVFLSGCMAVFWGLRLLIQLFYYDASLKSKHRIAHLTFTLAIGFLSGVFAIAALGIMR